MLPNRHGMIFMKRFSRDGKLYYIMREEVADPDFKPDAIVIINKGVALKFESMTVWKFEKTRYTDEIS